MLHRPKTMDAKPSSAETTPPVITPLIEDFVRELGASPPRFVEVVPDRYGIAGFCHRGVAAKIRADGGARVCGWTLWSMPDRYLTAEFHACWADTGGNLVDITPKLDGETRIVFAPDLAYGADFDFLRRPNNRLRRAYDPAPRDGEVDSHVAGLSAGRLAYESRRAAAAGLPLRGWMQCRLAPDPMQLAIDEFIAVIEELHTLTVVTPAGTILPASARASGLIRRQTALASAIGI